MGKTGKGKMFLKMLTLLLCGVFVCIISFSSAIFTDDDLQEGVGKIAEVHVTLAKAINDSTIPDNAYLTLLATSQGQVFNKTLAINTKGSTCDVTISVILYAVWEGNLDFYFFNQSTRQIEASIVFDYASPKWHKLSGASPYVDNVHYCTSALLDTREIIEPNNSPTADVLTALLGQIRLSPNLPTSYLNKNFTLNVQPRVEQA